MMAALDSNVLAYAEGVDDPARQIAALELIGSIKGDSLVIPVQALGELFNVLVRKARVEPQAARDRVIAWQASYRVAETTLTIMLRAIGLVVADGFQVWDAVILATAAETGCRILLSEDMHEGFTWAGVTVVNPFSAAPHPLIAELQRSQR